jgi:hypothetical protein
VRAEGCLADLRYAQAHGPNADGQGILAAKAVDPLSAVPIVDQPVR